MLGQAGLGLLGFLSEQRVGLVESVVLGLGFWVVAVGLEGERRGGIEIVNRNDVVWFALGWNILGTVSEWIEMYCLSPEGKSV